MNSKALDDMADTLDQRAEGNEPLAVAEMRGMAAHLRILAKEHRRAMRFLDSLNPIERTPSLSVIGGAL